MIAPIAPSRYHLPVVSTADGYRLAAVDWLSMSLNALYRARECLEASDRAQAASLSDLQASAAWVREWTQIRDDLAQELYMVTCSRVILDTLSSEREADDDVRAMAASDADCDAMGMRHVRVPVGLCARICA